MSTKINVRSPFYISYGEPTPPAVELTCSLVNLSNLSIDQYGNVTLPNLDYGDITSYTSTDSDFADGKFDTVLTDTSRTITFTIAIPDTFSNVATTIDCSATATQPAFVCTGGVTTNGTIPNQSIDSDGDQVTVDLTSYFTQGTDPIQGYNIVNTHENSFVASVSGDTLTITGTNVAGTNTFYVEATDGDPLTCDAVQPVQVTVTAVNVYDCDDAYLSGGLVNQDGTIVSPSVNGTITAIKETSGGTPITSLPANNTGSFIVHTLYFDITVPSGYTNAGATVECSKVYYQVSSALPEFTCEVAGLTNQAITLSGIISVGLANVGTIKSFSPISFPIVTSPTSRTVTYTITAPSSGYSNNNQDITCDVTMTQPAVETTCGQVKWYTSGGVWDFMTIAQSQAVHPTESFLFHKRNSIEGFLYQTDGDKYDATPLTTLGRADEALALTSTLVDNLINTKICYYSSPLSYTGSEKDILKFDGTSTNPTGGSYLRLSRVYEASASSASRLDNLGRSYYIKRETNGFISEIWLADWINLTITRIDNLV